MKFNSKKLIAILSVILCAVMIFAACTTDENNEKESVTLKPDNQEDNVAMLVKLINEAKLPADAENVGVSSELLEEVMKQFKQQTCEGTVEVDVDGQKESAYAGLKDGILCLVSDETNTMYMTIKDNMMVMAMSQEGQWFAQVLGDLNDIFGSASGMPEMPEIDLSKIKLPEIKADMITVEGHKYVISKDYIKSALTNVISELAKLSLPEGMPSVEANAQINAIKGAIEAYIDAFNPEVYLNIESEVILGGGVSINIEGAEAEEVIGINKLSASIEFGMSGNNPESLKVDFSYRETSDGKLYENSIDAKIIYSEDKPCGMELKANINIGGVSVGSSMGEDGSYISTTADISATVDVKADATKSNVNDEMLKVNFSLNQSNFKAYTYNDDYELVLDDAFTAQIAKNKFSVNATANAVVTGEDKLTVNCTVNTDTNGEKSSVKVNGTFVEGSAPNFKALPAAASTAIDQAIAGYDSSDEAWQE